MKGVMALAMRVGCNEEGNGLGGKSDGKEGGGQAAATRVMVTATPTSWVMATATRVASNKESNGNGGKSNGNKDKGGG